MQEVLVTGAAGFIGSHLVDSLLTNGWRVTALDNFDPFYSTDAKRKNIQAHQRHPEYRLVTADVRNLVEMRRHLSGRFDVIVHLAAKAGVRSSLDDPLAYHETNVVGTHNLLDLARQWRTPTFVFASSSSVYGINPDTPWSENTSLLMPISPYASTKATGELLGHVYSHLYGIRFVGLRLFTVFGPRQRPDLAIHKFASLMSAGKSIPIYGDGRACRDYTFVSDIVAGILAAMSYSTREFDIFNLGNNKPISILKLVYEIGQAMEIKPILEYLPIQPGDVPTTCASIRKARMLLNYKPATCLEIGLKSFAEWFKAEPLQRAALSGVV